MPTRRFGLVLLLVAACHDPGGAFRCSDDAACAADGRAGQCEPDGWCAFADPGCSSGARYGRWSGEGRADQCVAVGTRFSSLRLLAGHPGGAGDRDGPVDSARLGSLREAAWDGVRNRLYVAECEAGTLRAVVPGGAVTTLAGLAGLDVDEDGAAADARLACPSGLAFDGAAALYVG
ncbi:MAG: hypothetical protein LC659_10775, partial [Myxococcales bacterium]|nr:hypothetical protein [Myxococcales bacterium]